MKLASVAASAKVKGAKFMTALTEFGQNLCNLWSRLLKETWSWGRNVLLRPE